MTHSHNHAAPTHGHVFLGLDHEKSERKTWAVIWLCAAMMIGEIVGAGTPRFPSVDNPLLDMSTVGATRNRQTMRYLYVGGIAADGVARVVVKDREGRGLLWLPVRDNVYDSGTMPVPASAVQLDAQDAQGRTVARVPR